MRIIYKNGLSGDPLPSWTNQLTGSITIETLDSNMVAKGRGVIDSDNGEIECALTALNTDKFVSRGVSSDSISKLIMINSEKMISRVLFSFLGFKGDMPVMITGKAKVAPNVELLFPASDEPIELSLFVSSFYDYEIILGTTKEKEDDMEDESLVRIKELTSRCSEDTVRICEDMISRAEAMLQDPEMPNPFPLAWLLRRVVPSLKALNEYREHTPHLLEELERIKKANENISRPSE